MNNKLVEDYVSEEQQVGGEEIHIRKYKKENGVAERRFAND